MDVIVVVVSIYVVKLQSNGLYWIGPNPKLNILISLLLYVGMYSIHTLL